MDTSKERLEYIKKFHRELSSSLSTWFVNSKYELRQLGQAFFEAYEKMPDSVKVLAKFGWYSSMDMSIGEINRVSELFLNDKVIEADHSLLKSYQEQYTFIRKNILRKYPDRKPILEAAFRAHENQEYVLSIPIFLSHADGLCYEITGLKLYSSRDRKPVMAKLIKDIPEGTFSYLFLQPFTVQGQVSANKAFEEFNNSNFNRHEILHGISVDYGSEINSYKALSLLYYVSDILSDMIIRIHEKPKTIPNP
jgi:hypothetical protein